MIKKKHFNVYFTKIFKRKKIWAVTDFGIYVEMGICIIKTIGLYPELDPRFFFVFLFFSFYLRF